MTHTVALRTDKSCTMLVSDERIDRRVLDQARSLIRCGWQVNVLALGIPEGAKNDDQACYPEVNIVRIKSAAEAVIPPEIDEAALLQKAAELPFWKWNPHWIFSKGFLEAGLLHPASIFVAVDLPILSVTSLLANFFGASLLYDSHELFVEQCGLGNGERRTLENYEYWLAPLADQIVTINESVAGLLARRLRVPVPEVVLNCPAAGGSYSVGPERSRFLHEKLHLDFSKKIALLQGGLIPEVRNIENLVGAMRFVSDPDVVLVLMGPGSPEFRESLEASARADGTFGRTVFILDPVPQNQLLDVTVSADVGLIPYPFVDLNTYYCTPNKLFEYLVAGVPILANDLPELSRFVAGNGVGWNASMTSSSDIAGAINTFFSLDLEQFRRRAQRIAVSYTWEAQEGFVQELYARVLADRNETWMARRLLRLAEVNVRHGRTGVAGDKLRLARSMIDTIEDDFHSGFGPISVERLDKVREIDGLPPSHPTDPALLQTLLSRR